MNDYAIFEISSYIETRFNGSIFSKELSYSRWAVNEIMDQLIKQEYIFPENIFYIDYKTPIDIINEFIDDMNMMLNDYSDDRSFIFFTAKKEAIRVLNLFL